MAVRGLQGLPGAPDGQTHQSGMRTAPYTAGWCALAAAAAALEVAALRSGNDDATLSAHSRVVFARSLVPRLALVAGCAWWAWHIAGPQGRGGAPTR